MADFVGVDAADFKRVMGANARLTAENAALRETLAKVHGKLDAVLSYDDNDVDDIRELIEARIPELKDTP